MIDDSVRENKVLTIKEVANLLKVSVQTVKNYIYNGKIKSFKTPGGHHRIMESEINKKLDPLMSGKESAAEVHEEEGKELMEVSALIVRAMVRAIEGKENQLYLGHSDRVSKWSQLIAQELGLKEEKVEMPDCCMTWVRST